jgi:hypothetical protein
MSDVNTCGDPILTTKQFIQTRRIVNRLQIADFVSYICILKCHGVAPYIEFNGSIYTVKLPSTDRRRSEFVAIFDSCVQDVQYNKGSTFHITLFRWSNTDIMGTWFIDN